MGGRRIGVGVFVGEGRAATATLYAKRVGRRQEVTVSLTSSTPMLPRRADRPPTAAPQTDDRAIAL